MKRYLHTILGTLSISATLLFGALVVIQQLHAIKEFEASQAEVHTAHRIREIKSTQELEQLIKTEKNLVIKFSIAPEQCKYCRYLDPFFDKAVQAYNGPIIFASVLIPSDPAIRNWYKKTFDFTTVPTVIYYKNGQKEYVHGSDNATITERGILDHVARVYRI